jgi:hypothetical protein
MGTEDRAWVCDARDTIVSGKGEYLEASYVSDFPSVSVNSTTIDNMVCAPGKKFLQDHVDDGYVLEVLSKPIYTVDPQM